MKEYAPPAIRNAAFIAHGGAGKTTLAEGLLWTAKAASRLGRVDDGTSHLDYTPDETERKITVTLSLAQFDWKGTKINLLDTPGYLDFVGEVLSALRVADAVVLVLRGPAGVEVGSEIAWGHAAARKLPAIVAVTMMDKEHADFAKCVAEAADRLSPKIVPLYLPIGAAEGFEGVVDVLGRKAWTLEKGAGAVKPRDVPADLAGAVEEARGRLLDAIAESDEALLEKYLDGQELSDAEITAGLKTAVVSGSLIPALPVSGGRVQGTSVLLDVIAGLLPSPADVAPAAGTSPGNGKPIERHASPTEPVAAFIFKIVSEAHMGDMALFRTYSGSVESGMEAWNASAGLPDRVSSVYTLVGKDRHETPKVAAGDMGAAVKLKATHVGQTLTPKDAPVVLPPIDFPRPMLSVAMRPHSKGDEEKIASGMHRLQEEDPTLLVRTDELHQTLLYGMGELQLEIAQRRLKRRFQVDVDLSEPKVPYRETIRRKVEKSYRHKKQTGGRGQFAEAHLRLEPLPRGTGFEFVDEVVGGVVPRQYIPAVDKGIREAMAEGVVAGYQVVDVRAALFFGKYHPVDSSEMAFKIAGAMAFKEGVAEANPVLLEPILEIEVVVPEDYMGDVMGDVSGRRGKILGMESDGRYQHIRALVPQAETYRYSTHLRSLTQGRARYTTKFSHYEDVPRELTEKIVAASKEEREKERVS